MATYMNAPPTYRGPMMCKAISFSETSAAPQSLASKEQLWPQNSLYLGNNPAIQIASSNQCNQNDSNITPSKDWMFAHSQWGPRRADKDSMYLGTHWWHNSAILVVQMQKKLQPLSERASSFKDENKIKVCGRVSRTDGLTSIIGCA